MDGNDTDPDDLAWDIDDLYDNAITLSPNPADLLYREQQSAWEQIEFEPVTVEQDSLAALADAATQFHYIYLSELLIMGELLWNAPDVGTKRLATVLSASRMRDIDAWGQYIAHLKLVRPDISPPLRAYFRDLYEEDNMLARLMGLIFVDVFRKALADNLQDVEDPTFRRLMQRDAAEGAKNVEMTKDHLQKMSKSIDTETRETASDRLDHYVALLEDIAENRASTLETLGADSGEVLGAVEQTIASYREIIDASQ